MRMAKYILAVFVGIMVGSLTVWAIEMLGHYFYPPPANIDFEDKAALEAFIFSAPTGAKLFIILAYALGSFIGGLLTELIAQPKSFFLPFLTGAFLMAAGIINIINIPHPTWMIVSTLSVFLPFALTGAYLVRKKTDLKN